MDRPKTARTWREWFSEEWASQAYIPFRPLPLTDAEQAERDERVRREVSKDMTRLDIDAAPSLDTKDK